VKLGEPDLGTRCQRADRPRSPNDTRRSLHEADEARSGSPGRPEGSSKLSGRAKTSDPGRPEVWRSLASGADICVTAARMKSSVPKRSVVLAGRRTSVSLEQEFWTVLKEIAAEPSLDQEGASITGQG
jgi:hypothetical protein